MVILITNEFTTVRLELSKGVMGAVQALADATAAQVQSAQLLHWQTPAVESA